MAVDVDSVGERAAGGTVAAAAQRQRTAEAGAGVEAAVFQVHRKMMRQQGGRAATRMMRAGAARRPRQPPHKDASASRATLSLLCLHTCMVVAVVKNPVWTKRVRRELCVMHSL